MQVIQKDSATAAYRRIYFKLISTSDDETPVTGATVTAALRKNGGASAAGAGATTELSGGLYYYQTSAGEVDTLGSLLFTPSAAGAHDFSYEVLVVDYDPFSAPSTPVDIAAEVRTELTPELTYIDTPISGAATDAELSAAELAIRGDIAALNNFDPATEGVLLADGAHGGAATVITAKQIALTNADAGGIALDIQGTGTGNSHAVRMQSTNGQGLAIGSTDGYGASISSTNSDALQIGGATLASIIATALDTQGLSSAVVTLLRVAALLSADDWTRTGDTITLSDGSTVALTVTGGVITAIDVTVA